MPRFTISPGAQLARRPVLRSGPARRRSPAAHQLVDVQMRCHPPTPARAQPRSHDLARLGDRHGRRRRHQGVEVARRPAVPEVAQLVPRGRRRRERRPRGSGARGRAGPRRRRAPPCRRRVAYRRLPACRSRRSRPRRRGSPPRTCPAARASPGSRPSLTAATASGFDVKYDEIPRGSVPGAAAPRDRARARRCCSTRSSGRSRPSARRAHRSTVSGAPTRPKPPTITVSPSRICATASSVPQPVYRHQRTRGGAGSPCVSCQETTGLRSTPMRSISHSITSPGLRYSDAASGENPATPATVPVESTSPAEYPSAE